jgi:UDP-glucose 4-epimerase
MSTYKKHVIITGGNGFIGNAIAHAFKEAGFDITIICRGLHSVKTQNEYRYILADISSPEFVDSVMKDIGACDLLVHAAADLQQTEQAIVTNVLGSWHVFNLALLLKCSGLINISGIPIIGIPRIIPIDENHPVLPKTLYHATKYFSEILLALPNFEKLQYVNLRIAAPIGPDMPQNKILSVFINSCIKNDPIVLKGNGTRVQNYIDVRDIGNAVCLLAGNIQSGLIMQETLLMDGQSISNIELAKKCINTLGSNAKIIFDSASDPEEGNKWIINDEKIKKYIGCLSKIPLEKSIIDIYQEMRSSY